MMLFVKVGEGWLRHYEKLGWRLTDRQFATAFTTEHQAVAAVKQWFKHFGKLVEYDVVEE